MQIVDGKLALDALFCTAHKLRRHGPWSFFVLWVKKIQNSPLLVAVQAAQMKLEHARVAADIGGVVDGTFVVKLLAVVAVDCIASTVADCLPCAEEEGTM
jgi:hypothetical protein